MFAICFQTTYSPSTQIAAFYPYGVPDSNGKFTPLLNEILLVKDLLSLLFSPGRDGIPACVLQCCETFGIPVGSHLGLCFLRFTSISFRWSFVTHVLSCMRLMLSFAINLKTTAVMFAYKPTYNIQLLFMVQCKLFTPQQVQLHADDILTVLTSFLLVPCKKFSWLIIWVTVWTTNLSLLILYPQWSIKLQACSAL